MFYEFPGFHIHFIKAFELTQNLEEVHTVLCSDFPSLT